MRACSAASASIGDWTLGVADVFTAPVLTHTDTTTIGTPTTAGLDLIKEQILDANCDAAEVAGFALTPSTSGAIPGAYLVTYPEGGHLPMEQLPDQTVQHLLAFIRGLPTR